MTTRASLGPLLRAFFTDHLLHQKAVSRQTIHAYRDAFRLLLTFLEQHRQRKPEALTLDDLDAPVVLAFLDHLEEDRANSIASRNARLGAVRSFVRFAALRTPECVDLTSRVLAIPRKRAPRPQGDSSGHRGPGTFSSSASAAAGCRTHCGVRTEWLRPRCCVVGHVETASMTSWSYWPFRVSTDALGDLPEPELTHRFC